MKTLRIRCVRHLCLQLGTTEVELEAICSDLDKHPARHYYRTSKPKKSGKPRPITVPQRRLRVLQDGIQGLLVKLEMPPYFHGGIRGRSNRTNAEVHVGRRNLLTMDLADFFPSVTPRMVYRVFTSRLECSPAVARLLTRLCTVDSCLPQGAPTSTMLAVLASEPFALRVHGLAVSRGAVYTQYIDDITMSSDTPTTGTDRTITAIARQEGLTVNPDKTVTAHNGQEQIVTGVKVNSRLYPPAALCSDIRSEIASLREMSSETDAFTRTRRRIEGRIRYVAGLNTAAARPLWNRLRKALFAVQAREACR